MQPKLYIPLVALCICITGVLYSSVSFSQPLRNQSGILFYQLNTSDGLSDNYILDMCTDKGGNLWIASGEGLNMFNGKTVVRFFNQEYPQLKNDFTRQVVCDKYNRIWVLMTGGNVAVIDEQRRFHRVGLYVKDTFAATRRILYTDSKGVVLFTRQGYYTLKPGMDLAHTDSLSSKNFNELPVNGFDTLHKRSFNQIEPFDASNYLFTINDGFFKVNLETGKVERKYPENVAVLTKWSQNELLAYDNTQLKLVVIDLVSGAKSFPFESVTDQYGKPLAGRATNARKINERQLLITTHKEGIYIYDMMTRQLVNHRHDAADAATLANNSPFCITTDNTGWVFIGATPNGISYFKSNAVIGQQSIFQDRQGNMYDGYITNIASLNNDVYYIAASGNVMRWKRSTNTTRFVNYSGKGPSVANRAEVNYIAFDNKNRLWVGTNTFGIYVLDANDNLIKHFLRRVGPDTVASNFVRYMEMGPDGYMWMSTAEGICRINTDNFKIDNLDSLPLAELKKVNGHRIWFQDKDNVWIGTNIKGAWHYNFRTKKLENFSQENGRLISNDVFCFNKDKFNNIYIGTEVGIQVLLHNGGTKTITTKDGLLNKRAEALLLDKKGRMWIGNDVGLACFDIADSSLKVFDERYGLSVQGFRIAAYFQSPDDELMWGTERGLQYFYPDNLLQQKVSLPTTINRVETRDVVTNLTQNSSFHLSPSDNYVTFYFSSIDYSKHLRTFYEYKLEGIDEKWIQVVDQNFVRYSSLPAGEYEFKVRASNDNKEWVEATNTVKIEIAKPLWQQTWFKLLGLACGFLLIWYVVNFYRKKQARQREELETEMVINYFASRINSHQRTEDILWDIAKNCISKLKFEDCVIYLKDPEREMLVQKAAYGPKMERDFTIYQPIEIPIGKGIVGTVAQTGKAELIANTELDKRYIPDDARRYSEIAVPIIIDGEVVGVIDSEHSRRNFFSQQHLNILSTIAVLGANQIQRAKAEEEKQKAKIEMLENKQKATESRLQSLRLQMNPHFLFNALNSIQQMILANEEMVATRYLSRFSKLLRTILVHSDKEMVTLREELEILKLYVELESVRFKDSFKYTISCDDDIDKDEIKVPTLLMQPFVENAIWHGLMHKEGDRELLISFKEDDDMLQCVIQDNGVGREKASEARTASGKNHVSKGIAVSVERLKSMHGNNGHSGSLSIIDLKDGGGKPSGTRIEINFPIQN